MRIIYSQRWVKEKIDKKIKSLLPFIPGIKTADLLVKVFCYKSKPCYRYRGHYRNLRFHGFWESEWDYFSTLKKVPTHYIVLKFHPDIPDETLLHFIAHEYGHLKDWKRYNGQKYKCAQARCNKFADKCVNKYKSMLIGKIL